MAKVYIGEIVKVNKPISTKSDGTVILKDKNEVHICNARMGKETVRLFKENKRSKLKYRELVKITELNVKEQILIVDTLKGEKEE